MKLDYQPGQAKAKYEKFCTDRDPFLRRARENSKYTIPGLIPESGHTSSTALAQPYQSIGARGVNNLASKLSVTSYPPNRRMFRLKTSSDYIRGLSPQEQQIYEETKSDLEIGYQELEKEVIVRMERMGIREADYEAKRLLIVSGNALKYYNFKDDHVRVFPLNQYVVRRDTEGHLLEGIVKEIVDPSMLPEDAPKKTDDQSPNSTPSHKDDEAELYTHFYREKRGKTYRWCVYQEVYGQIIPSTQGHYGPRKCPWVPIRWTRIDGEDYGRSLCDECFGDLKAAEVLQRSLVKSAAIAARTIHGVLKGSGTNLQNLVKAEEGEFVYVASHDDVKPIESSKPNDFNIAKATLDDVVRRLSHWFLLNSAVQRNGERVTAEEIRYMVSELNDALGGVYGVLTKEDLQPTVELCLEDMRVRGEIPAIITKATMPVIITGVDALGRNHEAQALDEFLMRLAQVIGPENLGRYLHGDELAKRLAAGSDIDPKGLVKTKDELAAEQQQAAARQMTQALGPNAVKAASDQTIAQMQQTAPAA